MFHAMGCDGASSVFPALLTRLWSHVGCQKCLPGQRCFPSVAGVLAVCLDVMLRGLASSGLAPEVKSG